MKLNSLVTALTGLSTQLNKATAEIVDKISDLETALIEVATRVQLRAMDLQAGWPA